MKKKHQLQLLMRENVLSPLLQISLKCASGTSMFPTFVEYLLIDSMQSALVIIVE
jgi:hypothetical protein